MWHKMKKRRGFEFMTLSINALNLWTAVKKTANAVGRTIASAYRGIKAFGNLVLSSGQTALSAIKGIWHTLKTGLQGGVALYTIASEGGVAAEESKAFFWEEGSKIIPALNESGHAAAEAVHSGTNLVCEGAQTTVGIAETLYSTGESLLRTAILLGEPIKDAVVWATPPIQRAGGQMIDQVSERTRAAFLWSSQRIGQAVGWQNREQAQAAPEQLANDIERRQASPAA